MASVFKRKTPFHVVTKGDGRRTSRRVSMAEAERLRAAGEEVEEREAPHWIVRYRDASGAWIDRRCTARTKSEAQRLAEDLERKSERQRHGLEALPGDPGMTLAELCRWWLEEKCPPAS